MTTLTCRKCKVELTCNVIGDEQKVSEALGEMMLKHTQMVHGEFLKNIVKLSRIFNGFLVSNQFEVDLAPDSIFLIKQIEDMRDQLADKIMEFSEEEEEIKEDDEEEEEIELGLALCPECGAEIDLDELIAADEDDEEEEEEEITIIEEEPVRKDQNTDQNTDLIIEGEITGIEDIKG